ncbi:hypothetical protein CHLRE_01g006550v5 [Chlamydomonas reinhardtii]|uniref:Uncharacterized protein n=1 Tax=Chlamydomonas reinhardtii TaxID=3055 RepID=A0A2K3E534_CHLRE|nr:uncharacterized protein CHLRE_01g006550v5 [Chlamydomonas reinhardtii]PNW87900.1 hypothetical protein CHLRE_01g006550v5 [Chlamydomonas reinhardtii]
MPVSERSSPKPLATEQQLPPPPQQPNSKGGSSDFHVIIGNGPHLTPSDLEATTQSHASSGPEYVKAPAPASYSTAFEQPALIRSPHAYFDGPWRQISVQFCDDLLPSDRLPECHIGCLVHGFWAHHYSWQCDDIRKQRNSYVEFRRSRLLVKQRQRELQG